MSDPNIDPDSADSTVENADARLKTPTRRASDHDVAVSKTVPHIEGVEAPSPVSDVHSVQARTSTPGEPPPPSALPASANPGALVGTVLAGRYKIEQLLGSGGMGSVYRAEHVHMRKAFAIKVLHRELTFQPDVVARFEREAVAAARIEHPHVAAATDFGRLEDGACYLALEFVQGKALSALLREEQRLPQERALHIAHQIAQALDAAHAHGIVHRDLKPDNVMLIDKEGEPDFAKVLDFGIAKVRTDGTTDGEQLTRAGSIFGTPEYMAPEQAQGIEVDARADLYTLGIVLYEMLAGKTPFYDQDLVVVLTRQLTMDPPPLPDAIDQRVRALVTRLLRKDPAERPQTAAEVIAAIDALARDSERPASSSPELRARMREPQSSSNFIDVAAAVSARGIEFARGSTVGAWAARNLLPIVGREGLLRRRIALGRIGLPMWVPAVLVVVLGFVLVLTLSSSPPPGEEKRGLVSRLAAAAKGALDPELTRLLDGARRGDRMAIAELAGRPAEKRTAEEWEALARGYYLIHSQAPSVEAYAQAFRLDASLAQDSAVIGAIREMAESSDASEPALILSAQALGSRGADLVYDVWSDAVRDKKKSSLAQQARAVLDGEDVAAHASPALKVALDLSKARGCDGYKALLPRVSKDADERSVATLNKLKARSGCGFFGLGDCYPCLRRGTDLSDAIAAAKDRTAPDFGAPKAAGADSADP